MGLVGPKVRPKGVADGQQVNIPVPHISRSRVVVDNLAGLCREDLSSWYVCEKGYFYSSRGVTEWDERSVLLTVRGTRKVLILAGKSTR